MIRNNGFLELGSNISGVKIDGIHNNVKLEFNSKSFYYKTSTSIESAYYEVFTSYLAQMLGIETVIYDLAKTTKIGVIAEDFNKDNHPTISISKIVERYNMECLHDESSNLFNLATINDALLYYCKDISIRNNIMASLTDTYFLQAITGNIDVALENLLIIESEKKMLCPNFDYSAICMIDYEQNIGEFCLGSGEYQSKDKNFNPKKDISLFLSKANPYYIERFNTTLDKINENSIDEIFTILSSNTNKNVNPSIATNYKEYILNNTRILKEMCKTNEKSANY